MVSPIASQSRMRRAASDSYTPPPSTPHSPPLSSSFQAKPRPSGPSHTSSPPGPRLPSTRGVSLHPLPPPTPSPFRRPFLSPMDRLFIFFFEPSTLDTDAWANLPSPTPSPTPSPFSPFPVASAPPPSPTHPFLPLIGYTALTLLSLLLRLLMSHHSHSGQSTPPMYGDYEAQRHWMELTVHLPFTQWYTYDLQYWGLDYPPLTAYVSLLCGWWMTWVEPAQVALGSSRGYESDSGKMWMRLTVLMADCLTLLPAMAVFTRLYYSHHKTLTAQALMCLIAFIHPAFILIDHGHFQYNCVVLGLTVYAVIALFQERDYTATLLFCLALSFKQMALYYAPVFFVFLLSRAWFIPLTSTGQGAGKKRSWSSSLAPFAQRVSGLGAVVIGTFLVMLAPWLLGPHPVADVQQIFHRLFPVARGLYEDKVANWSPFTPHQHSTTAMTRSTPHSMPHSLLCSSAVFRWCASSLLFKWPQLFARETLVGMSLGSTLLGFLPSLVHLFFFPSHLNFLYSLAITSFSFFLFSFQVHEKTILFPLLPITLLFCEHPLLSSWMGFIATFSLYPLLCKDHLEIAYITMQLLFCCIVGGLIGSIPLRSERKETVILDTTSPPPVRPVNGEGVSGMWGVKGQWVDKLSALRPSALNYLYPYVSLLSLMSLMGAIGVQGFVLFVRWVIPTWGVLQRWPDLLTLIFVEVSFAHFVGFYLFLYWLQLTNVKPLPLHIHQQQQRTHTE